MLQTEILTAAPCDRTLNLLANSYKVYRDNDIGCANDQDDDRIIRLAVVLENLVHETWVPGYLRPGDRDVVDRAVGESALAFRHRLGRRGFEIVTAGVVKNILENAEVKVHEQFVQDRGDGRSHVFVDEVPMPYEKFEAVAREAIIDCVLRMEGPAFELRVCANDGKYFIPRRAGRGRFCRDSCRAAFGAQGETFRCAFCDRKQPHRNYSGLILAPDHREENDLYFGPEESEPPQDLRMSRYMPWLDILAERSDKVTNKSVCSDCIIEHRPAWARYVLATATSVREIVE